MNLQRKKHPSKGYWIGGGVPSRLLTLASGTPTYIDEVFRRSYEGTGSTQTITNGIDLAVKVECMD